MNNILNYNLGEDVRAFTVARDGELPCKVIVAHQVHDIKVAKVESYDLTKDDLEGYDALVTNLPGCYIGVRTADCIPVLLYDSVHKAVAAVHAGWRGSVNRVVQKAIFEMINTYGTVPSDLRALIGPGIGKQYFQVGEEVVGFFKNNGFPLEKIYEWQGPISGRLIGGHHIDLSEANKWLLMESGVLEENIVLTDICTYSDQRFHSARRDGESCGRNINAIALMA